VLISQGFGTSAPQAENGFVRRQIVSSKRLRRNIRRKKSWIFNVRELREWDLTARGTNPGCLRSIAIPPSFRGARRANPESRDSGSMLRIAPE
jgi:hypothetical protein